jgi:hypothetical protein
MHCDNLVSARWNGESRGALQAKHQREVPLALKTQQLDFMRRAHAGAKLQGRLRVRWWNH